MNRDLLALLNDSSYATAFTGAGVSTLSGIPDFRGKNGLYQNPENEKIFSKEFFSTDPSFYYHSCKNMLYADQTISPSLVHQRLAALEAQGTLKCIITQNIDCLHQHAGSKRVFEIHGSPNVHHCLACSRAYPYHEIKTRVQAGEIPPRCICGGTIKPDITFFGENLPEAAFSSAMAEAHLSDLMLVLGTSLTVFPAASIPLVAHRSGARLVIINDQPSEYDHLAVLRLWSLEEAFS